MVNRNKLYSWYHLITRVGFNRRILWNWNPRRKQRKSLGQSLAAQLGGDRKDMNSFFAAGFLRTSFFGVIRANITFGFFFGIKHSAIRNPTILGFFNLI